MEISFAERMEQLMKEHWSYDLTQKYKHLFETNEDGRILRGIECSEGWCKPVTKLLESFEWNRVNNTLIDNPNFDEDKPLGEDGNYQYIPNPKDNEIKIFQIKEKFGIPRVYYTFDNPKLERGLLLAEGGLEGACYLTCEVCSALHYNGVTSKNGWLVCQCDKCLNRKQQ